MYSLETNHRRLTKISRASGLEKQIEEIRDKNKIQKEFYAFLSEGHARGLNSSKSMGGDEIGHIKKANKLFKTSAWATMSSST